MTATQGGAELLKRIDVLARVQLCDPECEGRCKECPEEVLRDVRAFIASPDSKLEAYRKALEDARAALIKIRSCSIAGCEEGYGKPEKWADDLFRSHGDVAGALKTIDAVLPATPKQPD